MNVETCGHVADLIVMAHAFAELRGGVVARQRENKFQMWAQFRSNPLLSLSDFLRGVVLEAASHTLTISLSALTSALATARSRGEEDETGSGGLTSLLYHLLYYTGGPSRDEVSQHTSTTARVADSSQLEGGKGK